MNHTPESLAQSIAENAIAFDRGEKSYPEYHAECLRLWGIALAADMVANVSAVLVLGRLFK